MSSLPEPTERPQSSGQDSIRSVQYVDAVMTMDGDNSASDEHVDRPSAPAPQPEPHLDAAYESDYNNAHDDDDHDSSSGRRTPLTENVGAASSSETGRNSSCGGTLTPITDQMVDVPLDADQDQEIEPAPRTPANETPTDRTLRDSGIPSSLGTGKGTSSGTQTPVEQQVPVPGNTAANNNFAHGGKLEAGGAVGEPPAWKPTREFLLAFSALATISLGAAFDATSLSVALPTISSAIGGTALEAFWSGTSFLLASTVLQPTVAGLSNIFGRKNLIYVTLSFFLAGSIVSALAGNFTVLITGRTIQGVGGGGLLALTEVIITDLVPLHARGTWFSVLSAVWSVGTVIGPLLGAGFAQNVNWRWIFWINLPIIFAAGLCVILFLNQTPIPGDLRKKLARFDWTGSALFTICSTSFLFGITTGGVMYPWSSWRVLVAILVGAAGMVAFGFYEIKVAKNPIINKGIFNNWDMLVNYIMTVFHGAILWSIVFFLLLYYQAIKLYSPIVSAVAALPETLTVAPAGMVVGVVVMMTGHYRWSIWIGWALATVGCGLLYLLEPNTSVAGWIWLNIPVGVGTGMLFPAMALSIQAACEPALNGQAAAFFSFLRTFGQALGVAISGSIFQNAFRSRLMALSAYRGVADLFSRDATIIVQVIKAMPDGDLRRQLIGAYNGALHTIWLTSLAFAGLCFLLSLTIKGYSLNQEHITDQALILADGQTGSGGGGGKGKTGRLAPAQATA